MKLNPYWALFFLTIFSTMAHGSLGDGADSVAVEAKNLVARHSTTQNENYDIHVLQMSTTTIKEYVSKQGVVFAVTWTGVKKPDLSQLLGAHYHAYSSARSRQAKVKGRHPSTVKTTDLVVHAGGHMRSLYGRAYIRSAVPDGVNVDTLN